MYPAGQNCKKHVTPSPIGVTSKRAVAQSGFLSEPKGIKTP
jgi:hypothetical protein